MSLSLFPPRTRIQQIVYQTLLPYYSSSILEEYNQSYDHLGSNLLEMIEKDVEYLESSFKRWQSFTPNSMKSFEHHLKKCGYNVSGQYMDSPEIK
jgi:hypothetical protein